MATNLPYNLQEGTIAYAGKVMANFRALLGILHNLIVEGVGTGDVATILNLISQAMVRADETGNAGEIRFADGETVEQKFAAGTLNASLLDSEGLFYFFVNQDDGHLYVTASEGMEADNFEIDPNTGHLMFNLNDPDDSNVVHTYDLGQVKGDKGDAGAGGMAATTYDPNGVGKDLNTYTAFFSCYAPKWGAYFLTEDSTFDGNKTYYTYDSENEEYAVATVTAGAAVTANTYYEKLDATEYRLTDDDLVSLGVDEFLSKHITHNSGHAFIGPGAGDSGNDADGATAWADANVWIESQGNGFYLLKALGTIPTISIILQVTVYK